MSSFSCLFKFHEKKPTFFSKSEQGVVHLPTPGCISKCSSCSVFGSRQPCSAVYAAESFYEYVYNCTVVDIYAITLPAIKSSIVRATAGPK